MKTQASFHSITPVKRSLGPVLPCLKFTFELKDLALMSVLIPPVAFPPRPATVSAVVRESTAVSLIYVVDDEPDLTELYTVLLEVTGCRVRAFNDRAEALRALERETMKPDLLIIDYLGNSMLAEQFLSRCLEVCSDLRILMASGLSQHDVWFDSVRPDHFLQKPFTPDEFLREVKSALNTSQDGELSGVEINSGH